MVAKRASGARQWRATVVLALLSMTVGSPIWGQVLGSISGTAQDTTGAALPGVTVTVTSTETGQSRTTVTDELGRYRVLGLRAGQYDIQAELAGFQTEVRQGVKLTIGEEIATNLVLGIGAVREDVTVSAATTVINTTTTQTAGLVGEREVKDLPLNGRGFDNLITLNPGTLDYSENTGKGGLSGPANRFAVAGRRYTENLYLLNGIELTGVARSSSIVPGGASGQLLGIDSIREFNVVKDTYPAEYGKVAGGQVSIVTMSGSNDFHGSVFEFLRDDALDAPNYFDQEGTPPFRRNNFGVAAGGPIRANRTFVFGNYEGFRQRLGLSNLAIVPDEDARRGFLPDARNPGQLINVGLAPGVAEYFRLWPTPNGRNFGDGTAEAFSNPNETVRQDYFTLRTDHTFSGSNLLNVVYTFDDGGGRTPAANPNVLETFDNRSQVVSVEDAHTFSPTLLHTVRVGFSRASYSFDSVPAIDFPTELSFVQGRPVGNLVVGGSSVGGASISTAGSGSITTNVYATRNLVTVDDQVQIGWGAHLFKVGVWLQKLYTRELPTPTQYGQFAFASLATFLQGIATTFQVVPNAAETNFRQLAGAWYVQDTMNLTSGLTVNVGLRHEFTDGWHEANGRSSNFVLGPDGVLLTEPMVGDSPLTENRAKWLFGPRAALAWDVTGRARTVLKAAAGVHYSLMNNLGHLLDPNPPYSTRYQLTNVRFPLQVGPDSALPPASVQPQGLQTDIETPRVVAWSTSIEQELPAKLALRIGYVGSHGDNGMNLADLNIARPTIQADGTKFFPQGAPRANRNLANSRFARSTGTSDYHALEASLVRRWSEGLQLHSSYTYGHSIDNGSQIIAGDASNSSQQLLDPDDPERDRGSSSFDITQRFTLSGTYELPLGPGKRYVSASGRLASALVSGWQLNAIVNLQSGFPFTPLLGFNRSRNGDTRAPDRPDLAPGVTSYGDLISGRQDRWFDPTAFVLPPAGTYGNVGRNVLRGPGKATVDMSLFKTNTLSGTMRLQLRVEAFNVLNRANFGTPTLQVLNPDGTIRGAAGVITTTSTTARQIQLGAKLIW
jgi:hypothetical protein